MNDTFEALSEIVGSGHLLGPKDAAAYCQDWKKTYRWTPFAVARPNSTQQVSELVRTAVAAGLPIVPVGGHTGLNAGTYADGALMISLDRMNVVEQVRPEARVAVVQAGVVLADLHTAASEHGLVFPLTFGARGSAMIGGNLSTNAGGSNVLRYGNTRALTLGIEVVLADGQVLDLMSELHKDNTGYDLKDLFVGAEGTLGIITRAALKLSPAPRGYATAMVSCKSIPAALSLLNRLQERTGGMVEAFEYMSKSYMDSLKAYRPDMVPPMGYEHPHSVMVELGATSAKETDARVDGSIPLTETLEEALAEMIESGLADDAIVAQNETQRRDIWALREIAGEIIFSHEHFVDTDVSVPLDYVEEFIRVADNGRRKLDPESAVNIVSHLGDGNVHYTMLPTSGDKILHEKLREMVEDAALSCRGSFSAEHGIGLAKRGGMARRKDPVALETMRKIKRALDPNNLMNPGKVLPDD